MAQATFLRLSLILLILNMFDVEYFVETIISKNAGETLKLSYLAFWLAVIFSISCSFAQLIDISNTHTGCFQTGAYQTTL